MAATVIVLAFEKRTWSVEVEADRKMVTHPTREKSLILASGRTIVTKSNGGGAMRSALSQLCDLSIASQQAAHLHLSACRHAG
jgi:hypothetical protein